MQTHTHIYIIRTADCYDIAELSSEIDRVPVTTRKHLHLPEWTMILSNHLPILPLEPLL
jgi:hypothetical protein